MMFNSGNSYDILKYLGLIPEVRLLCFEIGHLEKKQRNLESLNFVNEFLTYVGPVF